MKKAVSLISCLLFTIGLASCRLPIQTVNGAENPDMIGQYQTVSVLLTQTSQAVASQAVTQVPPTRPVGFTPSALVATLTYTPVSMIDPPTLVPTLLTNQSAEPCDFARAGMPFDVTIPDDTRVRPGEYFSKTWRILNAGSCTWDRGYAVVWFSGDELGINRVQSFSSLVLPGQSVDFTVDMQAPETPGVYQSNWKLRNNQGNLFGIGPGGSAPFWARVVVVPAVTDTPTVAPPPPTNTPTPLVYLSSTVELAINSAIDLDSGNLDQAGQDDLRFLLNEQGLAQLQPENEARLALFGRQVPGFNAVSYTHLTLPTKRIV